MINPPRSIYTAHIDVVHGCQLRCVGCPNSILQPKILRMPKDTFGTILGNLDVEHIHTLRLFNFGEPLLHPELSTLVALIPQQRWKVSIVEISTNGQKVYWDDFEEMLKLEVVNRIVISCDGDGTPEDYERLRPPSKWSNFIEFLERARTLRDRWSPATQLMTRTVCEVEEHRQRWRSVLEPRGWLTEFRRWMYLPGSSQNMTGHEIKVPNAACGFLAEPEEFRSHPWYGQIHLVYVDWDGTVVPCCMHPKAGVLGNLTQQTYSEIRMGQARAKLKALMNSDRKSMPICGECDVGPIGQEGASVDAAMDALKAEAAAMAASKA
ncbi:SPASM domain-containing protein [Pseudomarimonas arenosa]|uniref:SPASM domain-containing protein n=1 Tax=Pseudomarimonas arenosa TaxID=2774145 RepID=A0AAW3ZG21_9GAMM|nr:SPASM domain-containing protein [Pseudomarimonas arenosa]MBD8525078.1 SPASM domain-containing protein [Pseudomarimonas arenosa]